MSRLLIPFETQAADEGHHRVTLDRNQLPEPSCCSLGALSTAFKRSSTIPFSPQAPISSRSVRSVQHLFGSCTSRTAQDGACSGEEPRGFRHVGCVPCTRQSRSASSAPTPPISTCSSIPQDTEFRLTPQSLSPARQFCSNQSASLNFLVSCRLAGSVMPSSCMHCP